MSKLKTYLGYLYEYLRYGDLGSIFASVNYITRKKSHKNDRIIRSRIGRFYCRKNTNDFQFANYRYEWEVKKFILKRIIDYNVLIDVGACVGTYCILAEKKGVRCFAFEPVPENYKTLNTNLMLNRLRNVVQVFPFGLGDSNRQANFSVNPVNTGASHIQVSERKQQTSIVEIKTFDSILPQLNLMQTDKIIFKLDVEGMEANVLKGAANFISKFSDLLFVIEIKHSDKNQIIEILNSFAVFETGDIDAYNLFARKISNLHPKS